MNVSIELFGQLASSAQRRQTLDLAPQSTVQDAVAMLGLNPEEIGIITINGVQSEMQDLLTAECRLCFFPHLSGG